MFLAIDVGNTQTTLGLFDEKGRMLHGWRMSTNSVDTADMLHGRLFLPSPELGSVVLKCF